MRSVSGEMAVVAKLEMVARESAEANNFKFTSLSLNKNYAAKIHRDENNLGPSMIAAFGPSMIAAAG